jgi:hypothetical protein
MPTTQLHPRVGIQPVAASAPVLTDASPASERAQLKAIAEGLAHSLRDEPCQEAIGLIA